GLNEIELSAERTCYRDPAPTMPQYHLNPAQIQAVEAALRAIRIDAEVSPAAELQSVMLRLNCLACHERDGLGGVGRDRRPYFTTINNIDLGDEGRIPPPLTGV